MTEIIVGISSCLLGHEVRFDGGHKRNHYIEQTLGRYFSFRPFCPEVESGLPIPRTAVQLRRVGEQIRVVNAKDTDIDVTDALNHCAKNQDVWLKDLSGYILKKDSPSCGMERVRVYHQHSAQRSGSGLFAQYLKDHYPELPLEEEGRLGDPKLRENFIQRVYVFYRWRRLLSSPLTISALTEFHAQHKLIFMSHDQQQARELGRMLGQGQDLDIATLTSEYGRAMTTCLSKVATRANHVNVLQHIQGYLKAELDRDDKAELTETIERYRLGQLPLIVPITLLRHHFRKTPDVYIEYSYYMQPYPEELTVMNEI